jgi:hypothetical protein
VPPDIGFWIIFLEYLFVYGRVVAIWDQRRNRTEQFESRLFHRLKDVGGVGLKQGRAQILLNIAELETELQAKQKLLADLDAAGGLGGVVTSEIRSVTAEIQSLKEQTAQSERAGRRRDLRIGALSVALGFGVAVLGHRLGLV